MWINVVSIYVCLYLIEQHGAVDINLKFVYDFCFILNELYKIQSIKKLKALRTQKIQSIQNFILFEGNQELDEQCYVKCLFV